LLGLSHFDTHIYTFLEILIYTPAIFYLYMCVSVNENTLASA
jgi:hypothetical protein